MVLMKPLTPGLHGADGRVSGGADGGGVRGSRAGEKQPFHQVWSAPARQACLVCVSFLTPGVHTVLEDLLGLLPLASADLQSCCEPGPVGLVHAVAGREASHALTFK